MLRRGRLAYVYSEGILQELSFLQQYRGELETKAGQQMLAGVARRDVLEPLCGPGITTEGVKAIASLLAGMRALEQGQEKWQTWKGPWQEQMIDHIGENVYSSVQAPRRLGKTYSVALWACRYIGAGYPVILAMPSIKQGTQLLFAEINKTMHRLGLLFPELRNRMKESEYHGYLYFENAGSLITLSMDKTSNKDGYPAALLLFDEAHKTDMAQLGIAKPFTDDYVAEGIGRVVLIGVGGPIESAIEATKYRRIESESETSSLVDMSEVDVFANLNFDAEIMMQSFPQLNRRFANAKAGDIATWNQHYRCLPVAAGTDKIFQVGIPKRAEWNKELFAPHYRFGIDPAKRADDSVLTVLEIAPSNVAAASGQPPLKAINIVDRVKAPGGMPYPQQGRFYTSWIEDNYPGALPSHITVETNGVGEGLADIVSEITGGINYYWSAPFWKDSLIGRMQTGARRETFGCPVADVRMELEPLMFVKDDKGKVEWQHNDTLSSAIAAMYAA